MFQTPSSDFFCQITYVKLLLKLSFLRVKGSTVILRALITSEPFFALLVLYIILDIYLLFKFSKSCMECFCVGNKKRTANSNTVILFFFLQLLGFDRPSSSRWARAATSYIPSPLQTFYWLHQKCLHLSQVLGPQSAIVQQRNQC